MVVNTFKEKKIQFFYIIKYNIYNQQTYFVLKKNVVNKDFQSVKSNRCLKP